MAELNEVDIADTILEELRCAICKNFLSYAPIQVLVDGGTICGHCAPSAGSEQRYRVLSLETIMRQVTFPCKYKKFGCEERLSFGQVNEHEANCNHRGFVCPNSGCPWEGTLLQLRQHFFDHHADMVKQDLKFELHLDEDKQGILMTVIKDVALIVKYAYSPDTCSLYYDIRYFTSIAEGLSCKIRLMNGSDHDYSVTAKGGRCQLYDYNFYRAQNTNVLAMNNLLPALDNPTCIAVAIEAIITKSEGQPPEAHEHRELSGILRCNACKEHLALPIFDFKGDFICADCAHKFPDSKPLNDENVKQHVTNSSIPCRWPSCTFEAKGDGIAKHEQGCRFRIYRCLFSGCEATFCQSKLNNHMKMHGYIYYWDSAFAYEMSFSKLRGENYIYTVVDKEIVAIKTKTYNSYSEVTQSYSSKHDLTMQTNLKNCFATVEIQHSHKMGPCPRSTEFELRNHLQVAVSMLSYCFTDMECVRVTIKVQ